MSASTNRAALINKLFKVAKKHFDLIKPPADRPVMEHMLYACCLEDTEYEIADEVFAKLQQDFFEWNEVRVTTVKELSEVMKKVYQPEVAALRLRRTLHGMFEAHYQFDLEFLKRDNLGRAMQTMERYRGITPFIVSYTAQSGLAGHSIPVDNSLLYLLYVIGAINESELEKRKIPGLSRIIPKAKGVEFSSYVHQLAVAFYKSPNSKKIRDIILEISKDAKDRFPKRGAKKKTEEEPVVEEPVVEEVPAEEPKPEPKKADKAKSKSAVKAADKKAKTKKGAKTAAKGKPAKPTKSSTAKKKATKKADKKKAAKKKAAKKKVTKKKATTKAKPAKSKAKPKKAAKKKATKSKPKKKSPTKRLAKKKPR